MARYKITINANQSLTPKSISRAFIEIINPLSHLRTVVALWIFHNQKKKEKSVKSVFFSK